MPSRPLGVLVHGAGWVASQHIDAFKANPDTRVVAISSRTVESARTRAAAAGLDVPCFDDLTQALARPDVDIVSICTPQQFHPANAIAIARAGKHMVIEKPVAMNLADLRAMQAEVQKAGVRTIVSFVLRWNPLFQNLKKLTADGAFGRVYCVETDYQSYSGDWWGGFGDGRTIAKGGSAFLIAGCHAIDALRWFAAPGEFEAADPVEVFAWNGGARGRSTSQYNPLNHTWHDGDPLEFAGLEMAMVRFANGVVGKVSANIECIQPYSFPIRIFGDKGTARDNRIYSHTFANQRGWVEIPTICPDSSDVSHHPFKGQMRHFTECIKAGRESHCNLADAVKTHEIMFAAEECYRTNRPVKLPLG